VDFDLYCLPLFPEISASGTNEKIEAMPIYKGYARFHIFVLYLGSEHWIFKIMEIQNKQK
jgi:hypothetical protein